MHDSEEKVSKLAEKLVKFEQEEISGDLGEKN
jgi:hypothetical protein